MIGLDVKGAGGAKRSATGRHTQRARSRAAVAWTEKPQLSFLPNRAGRVLARLSGRFSRLRSRPKSVIDGRPNLFKRDSDLVRLAAVSCSFLG